MRRLTALTVAVATGLMAFAAHAETKEELERRTYEQFQAKIDPTETSSIPSEKDTAKQVVAKAKSGSKGKSSSKAATVTGGSGYSAIIAKYAGAHGIPVALANAVVRIESNYRPNARGAAGEVGLMQIKPATARMMGYSGSVKGLYDPDTNIRYGMKYLAKAHQLGGGDTCGTILRYNAGHAATRMNKISAAYCAKVKRHLGS
jgi:soluble lytic murein transglycosylase-like protein